MMGVDSHELPQGTFYYYFIIIISLLLLLLLYHYYFNFIIISTEIMLFEIMSVLTTFHFNKIRDCVGKASSTLASNSYQLSPSFEPALIV